MLKLAVDIDRCLADFNQEYVAKVIELSGRDLFGLAKVSPEFPPVWNYPEEFGYSDAEVAAVWRSIKKDHNFWLSLDELPGAVEAIGRLNVARLYGHDVHFLTSRPGFASKYQSEEWLRARGMDVPTVILADDKTPYMSLLGIDAFVDDRLKNVNLCMRTVRLGRLNTRVYLVDAPYNRRPVAALAGESVGVVGEEEVDPAVIRVGSVNEMLDKEGL